MSKSLEFCKGVAKDAERSNYTDVDFSSATEYDKPLDIIRYILDKQTLYNITTKWNENIHYSIDYNDEAEFDYCVCQQSINDGTMIYITATIMDVMNRVANCATFSKLKGTPESGDFIKYTVGNVILIDEFGEYGVKHWMKSRTTVMLPVKYERN